ncbi:hypothetical protein [Tsukamurella sp. 1534]|uniref:hypothetical protein n=1 Tax=Tsukamurella sp. 1534 TaxID=1151061 RepID=UPI0011D2690A|nr:hypothetical protein [Tsukamurella sp. 1534]
MTGSVNWGDYEEYTVISPTRPEDDTRDGARAQYENWLAQKPQRKQQFRKLLELNGIPTGTDDASIQAVNDWFIANVEGHNPPIPEAPGMLSSRWYSVVIDIAIYLGDIIIDRYPNLYWQFFTPDDENYFGYQKPVIRGFTNHGKGLMKNYVFDLAGAKGGLGHAIVSGDPLSERDRRDFLHTLDLADSFH